MLVFVYILGQFRLENNVSSQAYKEWAKSWTVGATRLILIVQS